MSKVPGTAYRTAPQLEAVGAERTRIMATRMINTLADLHAVDPAAVGLADFGHPQGFLGRQVRRWKKQLDASRSRDLPGADELHAALEAQVPAESDAAIVHGDYRLDNLLVGDGDQITAVLDWEMATLGDPLTDVATLLAYQQLAHLDTGYAVADAATAPGFPDAAGIAEAYGQRSGRDLSHLDFYLGLAFFKIAVICEGIYYRFTQGQTLGEGFGDIGAAPEPLIQAGLATMKEYS
jgi:aminoglycoside phosphotransferase (APT) family kinase protein